MWVSYLLHLFLPGNQSQSSHDLKPPPNPTLALKPETLHTETNLISTSLY